MNDGMAARLREVAEAGFARAVAAVGIGETPRSAFVARFEQGTLRRLARRREREGPDRAAATRRLLECAARIAASDLLITQACVHKVTGAWRALERSLRSASRGRARNCTSRLDAGEAVGTLWLRHRRDPQTSMLTNFDGAVPFHRLVGLVLACDRADEARAARRAHSHELCRTVPNSAIVEEPWTPLVRTEQGERLHCAVSKVLAGLPRTTRFALHGRIREGKSIEELAKGLGMKSVTLRKRLDRTTGELRTAAEKLDLEAEWASRAGRTMLAHALYCCFESLEA